MACVKQEEAILIMDTLSDFMQVATASITELREEVNKLHALVKDQGERIAELESK